MRHLIVCCDGTWNTSDQKSVTNVKRLCDALADKDDSGNEQWRYYGPGVGTEGGLVARLTGGALGVGLDGNIMGAYGWLTARYEPGDRIALFGFSRGAYTVRSLAGMIAACGLVDTTGMDAQQTSDRIEQVTATVTGRAPKQIQAGGTGWPSAMTRTMRSTFRCGSSVSGTRSARSASRTT